MKNIGLSKEEMKQNIIKMYRKYKTIVLQENAADILKLRKPDVYPKGSLWIAATVSNGGYTVAINGDVTTKLLTFINNLIGSGKKDVKKGEDKNKGNQWRWKKVSFENVETIVRFFDGASEIGTNDTFVVNNSLPSCSELRLIAKDIKRNTGVAQPQPGKIFSIWEKTNNQVISNESRENLIQECFRKK